MKKLDLKLATRQIESLVGSRLPSIDPDAIDAALGTLQWKNIPAGIKDDSTMAKLLGLTSLPSDAELVVVTDASYGDAVGAFALPASQFNEFQAWHLDEFAERVFSGCDVIIWSAVDKRLWVVHHEGMYATAHLSAP